MHPGSLSEQYNVCGTAGCQCKDEKHPIKHGPYIQLSYTFKGKGGTKRIQKELVKEYKSFTSNYHKFRKYIEELVQLNIDLIKVRGGR